MSVINVCFVYFFMHATTILGLQFIYLVLMQMGSCGFVDVVVGVCVVR